MSLVQSANQYRQAFLEAASTDSTPQEILMEDMGPLWCADKIIEQWIEALDRIEADEKQQDFDPSWN